MLDRYALRHTVAPFLGVRFIFFLACLSDGYAECHVLKCQGRINNVLLADLAWKGKISSKNWITMRHDAEQQCATL